MFLVLVVIFKGRKWFTFWESTFGFLAYVIPKDLSPTLWHLWQIVFSKNWPRWHVSSHTLSSCYDVEESEGAMQSITTAEVMLCDFSGWLVDMDTPQTNPLETLALGTETPCWEESKKPHGKPACQCSGWISPWGPSSQPAPTARQRA